ncbi:MAG: histidinol dehydrogenase [Candidatus Nitrosocaldus sp.]|nr:histidinol dehydrogenase [Candidatus Nitrosocaldus sp.]MDW8000292.1 histidinol dehydrogenase [Candidatus Nitrosocaldus sp.]
MRGTASTRDGAGSSSGGGTDGTGAPIRVVRLDVSALDAAHMLRSRLKMDDEKVSMVKSIVEDVRRRGDAALYDYTLRFDGVDLRSTPIKVSRKEVDDAYRSVSREEVDALQAMKSRIEYVERAFLSCIRDMHITLCSSRVSRVFRPLGSVGCYIPGGRARYASSMLMCAVPARVAGVKRVVACTPPKGSNGAVDPLTLVAADLAGVDEVYRVGGAHAIAAMAYGSESIGPVSKIVGPGGLLVTIAKQIVSSAVAIDMLAGPTELLIVADESADARYIALDLIAQAEHAPDTLCGLITWSDALAYRVVDELSSLLPGASREGIVRESLSSNGFIALCSDERYALDFANEFAPEHLQVMVGDSIRDRVVDGIESAGMVLIGSYSPSSASDYYTGTNHVLPTMGSAKARASLTCLDFLKPVSMVELSRDDLRDMAGVIRLMARAEGLENHYRAVEARLAD